MEKKKKAKPPHLRQVFLHIRPPMFHLAFSTSSIFWTKNYDSPVQEILPLIKNKDLTWYLIDSILYSYYFLVNQDSVSIYNSGIRGDSKQHVWVGNNFSGVFLLNKQWNNIRRCRLCPQQSKWDNLHKTKLNLSFFYFANSFRAIFIKRLCGQKSNDKKKCKRHKEKRDNEY